MTAQEQERGRSTDLDAKLHQDSAGVVGFRFGDLTLNLRPDHTTRRLAVTEIAVIKIHYTTGYNE